MGVMWYVTIDIQDYFFIDTEVSALAIDVSPVTSHPLQQQA
jgi:hypothetical protein